MIKILGDINFSDWYFDSGHGIGTAIKKGANPFCHLHRKSDDFWIGNFECVCAEIQDDKYPFVISPKYLQKINHLDLYGLANNHVMQAGLEAFDQTCLFLNEQNVLTAGRNSNKSVVFSHQNKKVGLIAFSQRPDNFSSNPSYWHIPQYTEIKEEIDKLKYCDFVIAYIHWGYEFMNYPNIDQKLLAHWLIDNGIDLIVGMHPHVSQGVEIYKGKYIFYSLGNSVFNMNWEATKYGLHVTVDLNDISNPISVDYTYNGSDGFPKIVNNVPDEFKLSHLNSLLNINEENEKYFKKASLRESQYRHANHKAILSDLLRSKNTNAVSMISDFVKRRICKS